MASPEKIAPSLPETLPEDFSEWDSEAPATSEPESPRELWEAWEAAGPLNETPKPLGRSVDRGATLASSVDELRVSRSASSTQDFIKQKTDSGVVDREAPSTAGPDNLRELWVSSGWWEAWEASHSNDEAPKPPEQSVECEISENIELDGELRTAKRKSVTIVAVSVCLTLLAFIFMIPRFHHVTKSVEEKIVRPLLEASTTPLELHTAKPSASEPFTHVKQRATIKEQRATNNQPANEEATVNSAQVPTKMQTQMMDDQLTAPTQISQDIQKQAAQHVPPPLSFGMAGADGLGGSSANVSVFDGQAQSVVEAAPSKPVVISSVVADGMLIKKTAPVYPSIAIEARVSGTVELRVTISKTGTIKDLHVVNGPAMLKQAAVDAVRTWRYKPYRVNNKPREVQTTVNLLFTLGG